MNFEDTIVYTVDVACKNGVLDYSYTHIQDLNSQ